MNIFAAIHISCNPSFEKPALKHQDYMLWTLLFVCKTDIVIEYKSLKTLSDMSLLKGAQQARKRRSPSFTQGYACALPLQA